jgi:hypothetical protein
MRRRVLVEVRGSDGRVSAATGERPGPTRTAATLGPTLTEGKTMVAALQQVLVSRSSSARRPPSAARPAVAAVIAARSGR